MDITTTFRYQELSAIPKEFIIDPNRSFPLRMTDNCRLDLINKVENWLNDSGLESLELYINLQDESGFTDYISSYLRFSRKEVFVRGISNEWQLFHIATAHNYDGIISSKCKLTIQFHSSDDQRAYNLKNSVDYATEFNPKLMKTFYG